MCNVSPLCPAGHAIAVTGIYECTETHCPTRKFNGFNLDSVRHRPDAIKSTIYDVHICRSVIFDGPLHRMIVRARYYIFSFAGIASYLNEVRIGEYWIRVNALVDNVIADRKQSKLLIGERLTYHNDHNSTLMLSLIPKPNSELYGTNLFLESRGHSWQALTTFTSALSSRFYYLQPAFYYADVCNSDERLASKDLPVFLCTMLLKCTCLKARENVNCNTSG